MTFEQLRYVEVLSHNTSMQKAADALHITKSGLSMAIAQLEEELGVQLFEKTNRGSFITSEGIQLLSSVTAILKHKNTLISAASGLGNKGITETFRLRYMSTMFSSFLRPFLDQYQEKYTHLRYDISCSQIESIISDLNSHKIDIGFVAVNSTFDDALTALEFVPVIESKMVLACSKTNPLASALQITPEMLKEQKFCLYNETFQDRMFDRLQFMCGPLNLVLRTDDPWAIHEAIVHLNAVCLGRAAMGMLSRDSIMADLCHVPVSSMIDDNVMLGWLSNPKYELSPLKKEMINSISSHIKKRGCEKSPMKKNAFR